eukprot:gene29959-39135_t
MRWFEKLFGFVESTSSVQSNFQVLINDVKAIILRSKVNGRDFNCGTFSTPKLNLLRAQIANLPEKTLSDGSISYQHLVIGDAFPMHASRSGATFQVASQFNCLEFTSFHQQPENGIEIYEFDGTQGPTCALACAAGTAFRNYFVPIFRQSDGTLDTEGGETDNLVQLGQSKDVQLNNLDALEKAVDNDRHKYWYVHNGYTFSNDASNLERFLEMLATKNSEEVNYLMGEIKVGLHKDVGVNFATRYDPLQQDSGDDMRVVTQVYSSALSCAYSGIDCDSWAAMANLVLSATYEESRLLSSYAHCDEVYLTFVGGIGSVGRSVGRWQLRRSRPIAKMDDAMKSIIDSAYTEWAAKLQLHT